MKIIISPAKKMNVDTDSFDIRGLPEFLKHTRILEEKIRSLSLAQAKALWKCNDKLAELNYTRFKNMDLAKGLTPAVMSYEGGGVLTRSLSPDYYSAACALREAGLFRGSGSGVGEGFDLYLAPTRGESLVMFLRLLGEESDALAFNGTHPFTDVPGWLSPYVAWAWQKGYTSGVAADRFGSDQPVSAVEYEEFLLRALGYSTAGVDDYTTSLERALGLGGADSGRVYHAAGDCLPPGSCGLRLLVQPGYAPERRRGDLGPAPDGREPDNGGAAGGRPGPDKFLPNFLTDRNHRQIPA